MKMNKIILSAALIILLTNVIVLAGAAYNRSDEPVGVITLTERELRVNTYRSYSDENSGTAFTIRWEAQGYNFNQRHKNKYINEIHWLTEPKLESMGVDISEIKSKYKNIEDKGYSYRTKIQSIDAILVLEYDGKVHKKAVDNAKKILDESIFEDISNSRINSNQRQYDRLKTTTSRLNVIDAGFDIDELLGKYKGNNKYLLMRGEISVYYDVEGHKVYGQVKQLFINKIHVPLPYSEFIEKRISSGMYDSYSGDLFPPRYKVKLNIGLRLEPWVVDVQEI